LADPSPLVRGAAVWALSRLVSKDTFAALTARHHATETDPEVREEWTAALEPNA
jgi:epoxyqueuosine reductase